MPDWVSKEDALAKMQRYCAYQDRCHKEVRARLIELGVYRDWAEEIMVELIQENFLNEERFARSFARGKFRIKQWGRNRIRRELKQRDISEYCIRKAMEEIDPAEYRESLNSLAARKAARIKAETPYALRNKLARYLIGRGFEPELSWQAINELFPQ